MALMTDLDVVLAHDGEFTKADRDALPEDSRRRYEFVDGALIVTPSPTTAHQRMLMALLELLRGLRPRSLDVVVGPLDLHLDTGKVVVPDLMVAPVDAFGPRGVETAPMLVVEVRSPATALLDRTVKRDLYEQAGVASYWMLDPAAPSVTVLEPVDGRYVERGTAIGADEIAVERPFPVVLRPADLVAGQ